MNNPDFAHVKIPHSVDVANSPEPTTPPVRIVAMQGSNTATTTRACDGVRVMSPVMDQGSDNEDMGKSSFSGTSADVNAEFNEKITQFFAFCICQETVTGGSCSTRERRGCLTFIAQPRTGTRMTRLHYVGLKGKRKMLLELLSSMVRM